MAFLSSSSQCVRLCTLVVYWTLFLSLCIDAAIVWTKPPPVHTPSSRSDTRTTNIQLVNGSSEERLIWEFTLTGETLDKIIWDIGLERIGIKRPSGATNVIDKLNYLEHFNISASDPATLIIYDVTEADEVIFSCTVENDLGDTWRDQIQVEIVVESKLTSFNGSQQTVCEGDDITLLCNATGKPDPNITWTRVWKNGSDSEVRYTGNMFALNNINRSAEGIYCCTAYNGVGKSVNHTVDITVNFPPVISSLNNQTVEEGDTVTLNCDAPGSPEPTVTWTNVSSGDRRDEKTWIITNINRADAGEYRCDASNECGNHSRSTFITVHSVMRLRMTCKGVSYNDNLANLESKESNDLTKLIVQNISNAMNGTGLREINITKYGQGSVVVFFTLVFNQPVDGQMVISLLKNATSRGDFGDLDVDPSSIMLIQATVPPSTTTRPPTLSPSEFSWFILGIVVGAVIPVVVVIAIVAWYLHKKRKCGRNYTRDKKIQSENEAQPLEEFSNGTPNGENAENAYTQVNHGDAKSGPAPTSENNQGAASTSAVPPVTYAVVDKSRKNEKPPEYAVVDKSKKKKKKKPEEPAQQYAQVAHSVKKKHAKPGEVLYADLGEFRGNNSLPKVSTSPELLPPIKKSPAYVETQYADITQFLKGNATLPSSDGTGGVTPAAQEQPTAGAQVGTGGAAATPSSEEAGGGSSHVSKL